MLNQDYPAIISDLLKRVDSLEQEHSSLKSQLNEIKNPTLLENQDWSNATLLVQWGICERTAAYYRKKGLDFYKMGGRVYYTPEAREAFLERNNKY